MVASPSLTLTRDELENLTGFKQTKRMAEWLAAGAWVFEPARRRGEVPKVDRAYYLARMSGQQPIPQRRTRVNVDWMLEPTT